MQPSQERPSMSGRPSLLSPDDPPESDATRILGVLDDTSGRPMAAGAKGKRIRYGWLAISVAVIAAVAGGSAWWGAYTHKDVVLASTVPVAPAAAPAGSDAEQVSTAAILHDVPDAQAAAGVANAAMEADLQALIAVDPAPEVELPALVMLAPATAAADTPPAGHIVERTDAKVGIVRASARPAAKEADNVKRAAALPPRRTQPARAAPDGQDSDVTLLAALVAHSKANEPKSTIAAKLKQCTTLASVAEAESCRARLCAGSVNVTECRNVPAAKAGDEA